MCQTCSCFGIDRTWLCMRYVRLVLHLSVRHSQVFQQVLYQHIIDAVNDFPAGAVRQRYARAALSWRAPYWDWAAEPAAGQSVYPNSVTTPTVDVEMPNGTTTIANPLYQYEFDPVSASDFYFNPVRIKPIFDATIGSSC